jgi:hypothetical protein
MILPATYFSPCVGKNTLIDKFWLVGWDSLFGKSETSNLPLSKSYRFLLPYCKANDKTFKVFLLNLLYLKRYIA